MNKNVLDINARVEHKLTDAGLTHDEARDLVESLLEQNGAEVAYFILRGKSWFRRIVGTVEIWKYRHDPKVEEITKEEYQQLKAELEMRDLGLL